MARPRLFNADRQLATGVNSPSATAGTSHAVPKLQKRQKDIRVLPHTIRQFESLPSDFTQHPSIIEIHPSRAHPHKVSLLQVFCPSHYSHSGGVGSVELERISEESMTLSLSLFSFVTIKSRWCSAKCASTLKGSDDIVLFDERSPPSDLYFLE